MGKNVTVVKITTKEGRNFFDKLSNLKQERLKELESYAKTHIWVTGVK